MQNNNKKDKKFLMVLKAKYFQQTQRKGIKILTRKQMLQSL